MDKQTASERSPHLSKVTELECPVSLLLELLADYPVLFFTESPLSCTQQELRKHLSNGLKMAPKLVFNHKATLFPFKC